MNRTEQLNLLANVHDSEVAVLGSKGNDYASDQNLLKNFSEVSEICKMLNIDSRTLYGTHMFYIILKIQRLCNLLLQNKKPNNESVEDTILDLRNYVFLLQCSIKEEEKEKSL